MEIYNIFKTISDKDDSSWEDNLLVESITDDSVSISEAAAALNIANMFIVNEGYALEFKHQPALAKQIFDMDAAVFVYLNEGIIGGLINGVRGIVSKVRNFMRGLQSKVTGFMDRFKADNVAWVSKYESQVSKKSNNYRSYVYEGRKWDPKYFEYSAFPNIYDDIKKNTDGLTSTMSDFFNLMEKQSPSKEEMDKAAEELKKAYPKGFKELAKDDYEKSLGAKMDVLQDVYYKKGAGAAKITINGFSVIKPADMVDHIKKANDRIAKAQENMNSVLSKVEELYKIIDSNKDKLDNLDKRLEDEKESAGKNESVQFRSLQFGLSSVFNEASKGKVYTKEEAAKNKADNDAKVKRIMDRIEAEKKKTEDVKEEIKKEKDKDDVDDDKVNKLTADLQDKTDEIEKLKLEIQELKNAAEKPAEEEASTEDNSNEEEGSDKEEGSDEDKSTEEGSEEDKEKSPDEVSAAIKYSTELRQIINQAIDTWNLTISIYNKILGVHYALVKDSTTEFKYQLTKFVNEKN